MKKIKHSFFKSFNAVLIALLGLLGFSSCETDFEQPELIVKGTITNKIDGKPVKGIRVTRLSRWTGIGFMYGTPMPGFCEKTAVHSNQSGHFVTLLDNTIPHHVIHLQDIDGEKNGLFQDTTIVVEFGRGNIANLDIVLTPKEVEDDTN